MTLKLPFGWQVEVTRRERRLDTVESSVLVQVGDRLVRVRPISPSVVALTDGNVRVACAIHFGEILTAIMQQNYVEEK